MKKGVPVVIFVLCLLVVDFNNEAQAERVHGHGANLSGSNAYRTYKFEDNTVNIPLSISWKFNDVNSVPIGKGFGLKNYRLYFGKNHRIYGINDQTGSLDSTNYVVGNPFIQSFSSVGWVTSAAQLLATANSQDSGTSLYVGTSYSYVMKLDGFGRFDKQGDQILHRTEKLYGGAIEYLNRTASNHNILVASHRRLHLIDTDTMTRKWWYDGGEFTGITRLENAMLVVTDNGTNSGDGKGLIYRYAYQKSGGPVDPDTIITYKAGIPKHPAYDRGTNRIYTVDREGRIYIHRQNGQLLDMGYVGDRATRGYLSVGGVLVTPMYVYASSKRSSQGWSIGTVTRFSKSDVDQKTWYIHNAPITTTPIFLSGLIYFGDAKGKVWALNPKTMKLVKWYLGGSGGDPQLSYDIGGDVKYIMGADNHLIAASQTGIFGFKGRPDFHVTSQKVNGKHADGSRFNFTTSTLPSIKIESIVANKGTFDYEVYDDFGGSSTQFTELRLVNLDSGKAVSLNEAEFYNNVPNRYKSESDPDNPHKFQVPANREFSLFYTFHPSSEGRYKLTTIADYGDKQAEFGRYSNRESSIFHVVDMRKPSAEAQKNKLAQTEINTFRFAVTQKYSEKRYRFVIENPSGNIAFSKSGSGRPPTEISWTIPDTSPVGTYHYHLQIINRYGDTLKSDVKPFTVVANNHPPVAKFEFQSNVFYEGDDIRIVNRSYDPDQDKLKSRWVITASSGDKSIASKWSPTIVSARPGSYNVRLTVTDPSGASDTVIKTIKVLPLGIVGKVLHTPRWEQIHQNKDHSPDAFYSGEVFLLQSTVSNAPVEDVTVSFVGDQMNGDRMKIKKKLISNASGDWVGKIYDSAMTNPATRLVNGPVLFKFSVHYRNGVVKHDFVGIRIIGSVYDQVSLHRSF